MAKVKKRRKHYTPGAIIWLVVEYASLIFFSLCAVIPLVSCVITAFKTKEEYDSTSVMTLPKSFLNFDNFITAFKTANMGHAFVNSVIVMVSVLLISVVVGTQLAYVLNRFKFPGNGLIRNLFFLNYIFLFDTHNVTRYNINMIKSFAHKGLREFYESGSKKGIQPEHAPKLGRMLDRLDASISPQDMNLPGYRLHPLKGDKQDMWAVTVNGNWRLTFYFEGQDAYLLDYQDYH